MNKQELLEHLKPFIVNQKIKESSSFQILNLGSNLQKSKKDELVFYKVRDNQKSIDDFKQRLKNSEAMFVVLNESNLDLINILSSEQLEFVTIKEESFLAVQKILSDIVYPNKKKLKIVGVTGTNGKTTTVNLAMRISESLGHPAFSVGTIGVFDSKKCIWTDLESTTPSYLELRKLIHGLQDKYQVMFIEVSSHALSQDRFFDVMIDVGAWTSFSQDHLDYHQTMEEYFKAKALMATKKVTAGSVVFIPANEIELQKMIAKLSDREKYKIAKTFKERNITSYPLFYYSEYNQSNMELALELNEYLWKEVGKLNLEDIETPKGRFSIVELWDNSIAIIDYAHTPDALINIGEAIKKAFPNHKITVIFGCGGNRDKTKRPLMGKAVKSFADKIMVTSDNPRDENPEDIIMDIIPGLGEIYEAMVDRKMAIETCLDDAFDNEVILIAGKGHEEYQEIKGVKHPFSDFEVVKNYLESGEE